MKEHLQVIEQALNRLYKRIHQPTATDSMHHRVALKAVRSLRGGQEAPQKAEAPQAPANPVTSATVAQVQALVEQGKLTAADALAFEREGDFPRKTLISWLEQYEEDE